MEGVARKFLAMADDAPNVVQFACFCPLGDTCSKRGKRSGTFPDEESARLRIKDHLISSSYHYMTEMEATDLSNSCDTIEVVEEPVWQQQAWEQPAEDNRRSSPYESKGKGKSSKGKSRGGKQPAITLSMPSSFATAPQHCMQIVATNATALHLRLEQQAIRCETAARQAGRFARQAAAAFDEEATVLRDLVDEIRRG